MGNLLQNLTGLLTSPITFFVLFALIGGIGRFASWVKDQRAKRDALAARKAAEAEALRTGGRGQAASPPAETNRQQSAAAERQARLRQMQEQRAAQLRELQQKRLAELRARRAAQQAQSGGRPAPQAASPGQPPAPTPTRRPSPAQAQAQSPRRTPTPAAVPADPRANRGPDRQPAPAPATPPPTPRVHRSDGAYARTRDGRQNLDAFDIDRRDLSVAATSGKPGGSRSSKGGSKRDALFATREDLRRGIIAAEILGPPVSLRDDA